MMITVMTIVTTMNMMMTKQSAVKDPLVWQWHQHSFRAMNTDIHFSMIAPEQKSLVRMVEESFRYFEQLLSRFRADSELSHFNNCCRPFVASQDFYAAVEAAVWAAQQTNGIYDPAILGYLEEAGYDCTFEAIAHAQPLGNGNNGRTLAPVPAPRTDGNAAACDYHYIGLESFTRTIHRPAGLRIDLGGMGKGWTVDRVVDELCASGHFLLNAGGDLYAYGTPGKGHGWEVHLAHPQIPAKNFATLILDQHGLATSTTARRRWLKNGIVQHHLIDPRSGRPAQTDAISVSVVAGRVFTAEIYAKVALILGIEQGLAFLEALPEVEGAMFSSSNEVHLTSKMDRYLDHLDPAGY